MDLSKNIKRIIGAHGLTIKDLAKLMPNDKAKGDAPVTGIAPESLSRMINGNISLDKLQQIANILGCDMREFLLDDDEVVVKRNEAEQNALTCPKCGTRLKLTIDEPADNRA